MQLIMLPLYNAFDENGHRFPLEIYLDVNQFPFVRVVLSECKGQWHPGVGPNKVYFHF